MTDVILISGENYLLHMLLEYWLLNGSYKKFIEYTHIGVIIVLIWHKTLNTAYLKLIDD